MSARVLLVEDNPTNLALMKYLLSAHGFAVTTAPGGLEGLAAASREKPDVILLDLQMPRMNGFETATALRSNADLRRVALVAVTALAMVGDREKVLAHGFSGYITKPINPETFAREVQAFAGVDVGSPRLPMEHAELGAADLVPPSRLGRRILVVDDTPVNLKLARSTLEPFGYTVLSAQSVPDALEILKREPPNLILSDIHMPGLDGYDFLRVVKTDSQWEAIPFVLISSAESKGSERLEALCLGASRLIVRPISPDAFIRELEACLTLADTER
jgi:two-component system, cell cycle response regulator